MFEKYLKELSKSPLFAGIDEVDLGGLIGCLQPNIIRYNKNDYITIAGSDFRCIGIVLSGQAAVYKDNVAGDRVMMTIVNSGNLFGEMLAFSSQNLWPASVQALETCEILFLAKEKIVGQCERICPWHRNLIQNMLGIISERALFLNKKLEYLSIRSMRGKISTFLLEQYKIAGNTTFTLPMKRNEMSEFLNVSRPSMSREMARMKDEGIIDFHLSTVKVKDLEALKNSI